MKELMLCTMKIVAEEIDEAGAVWDTVWYKGTSRGRGHQRSVASLAERELVRRAAPTHPVPPMTGISHQQRERICGCR